MMQLLSDPGTTQYDLRFSVLGIPVRVHPTFWFIGLLLGSATPQLSLVAIWIGCLFLSILVHELGHALAARSFGWPPDIVLHGFGGYFECTLYKDIMISILPSTHSKGEI